MSDAAKATKCGAHVACVVYFTKLTQRECFRVMFDIT